MIIIVKSEAILKKFSGKFLSKFVVKWINVVKCSLDCQFFKFVTHVLVFILLFYHCYATALKS